MSNLSLPMPEMNSRWRFDWVLPVLLRPRRTFAAIIEATGGVAFTPIFLLALSSLVRTLVIGAVQEAAKASGQIQLPPGFEWYTPEQQAQFYQAASATSGPVFVYLLPALMTLVGVFLGWLILSWLLHLVMTMFGGRGSSQQASNVVAWALLPFVIRDIVRIMVIWSSNSLIAYPGLSGFAPTDDGMMALYLAALLRNLDLYLLWFIILTGIGLSQSSQLRSGKAWFAVLLTLIIIQLIRATPALIAAQFNDLTVIRPFF
jgi:hypothetical protein